MCVISYPSAILFGVQNRQATLANVAHLEHLGYEWCGVRSWGGPDAMKMPRLQVVLAQMWYSHKSI